MLLRHQQAENQSGLTHPRLNVKIKVNQIVEKVIVIVKITILGKPFN